MGCESTKLIQAWLARLMASAGGTDKDGYRGNGAFRAPFLYRITRWLAMLAALFQLHIPSGLLHSTLFWQKGSLFVILIE